MGSVITLNDTLQLTREQGFPAELVYENHQQKPYSAAEFEDKIFEFTAKPTIRVYQAPPVRNFLVENKEGKWLYWGLVHVTEVHHDYIHKTTSGKFKIIYIYPPEDMEKAHDLIDRNSDTKLA